VSNFRCSFVYLHCVVPVSMNYTLCSETFLLKVLQKRRLVRFPKRTNCWCAFSWRNSNQQGHFIRRIQSSVSMVRTSHTDHGKISSVKRNSGRRPKLSERDDSTLKRTVSKTHRTTAAKVTATLNI